MESIKSHKCPSCGSNLTIDNDKQIYLCKFCGSTYDYEYFREDNAIEMGQTYLSRGEFDAAADAFRFLLTKDPHDFKALRGLMLAAGRTGDVKDLTKFIDSGEFICDEESVEFVKNNCSSEDKEYFDDFNEVYSKLINLTKLSKEYKDLRNDKKQIEDKIQLQNGRYKAHMIVDRDGVEHEPKNVFIVLWVIAAIVMAVTIFGVIALYIKAGQSPAITVGISGAVVSLLLIGWNCKVNLSQVKAVQQINTVLKDLYDKAAKLQERIDKLSDEIHDISSQTKRACAALCKKDNALGS